MNTIELIQERNKALHTDIKTLELVSGFLQGLAFREDEISPKVREEIAAFEESLR